MASQADKLRAKRASQRAGRPRKQGAERYPSGKIKPEWSEREAKSVVIDARRRLLGLTKKQADDPRAGYLLGILELDGKITEAERKAGDTYAEKMASYYGLTGIPFPSPRAQELFRIAGHDGEVSASRAMKARMAADVMMKMEGALLRCKDGPQVRTTIRNVCLLNFDNLRDMPERQLRWLRSGLRALILHQGLAS